MISTVNPGGAYQNIVASEGELTFDVVIVPGAGARNH